MEILTNKSTFSVNANSKTECVLGLARQFVTMDIESPKKDCFKSVSPVMKHMNSAFISQDKSKCLFLNTTGSAFLYDLINKKTLKKICFGDQLYAQYFAGYDNGYFYMDQENNVLWFDINKFNTRKLENMQKCWALYDYDDSIYFLFILNYDVSETFLYELKLSCFSKETGKFKDEHFMLPKGTVERFKRINDSLFLVTLEHEYGEGICESIYILDCNKNTLVYLMNREDLDDVCIYGLDIHLERNILFILTESQLLTIDLINKNIIHSVGIIYVTDVRLFGDHLIVTSWDGAFKFDLEELI